MHDVFLCFPSSLRQRSSTLLAGRGASVGREHYADAERAFEKLEKLSPGTAEIHARLGLVFYQEGKFEQAVPALRQAIKLKPGLPNIDVLLAMSLSELGHYEEALSGLEKGFRGSGDLRLERMSGFNW